MDSRSESLGVSELGAAGVGGAAGMKKEGMEQTEALRWVSIGGS